MTKEEILKRVKKFQGANREFSQELPPIIEGLIDLIDEAGPEVVDNLESNDPDKALSANMGKELNVSKMDAPSETGQAGQILQLDENGDPEWVEAAAVGATYDSAVSDTSTNAIQNKTIKKYVDDNFAQKDGYYGSLTAGAAENIVGQSAIEGTFLLRTTAGDADVSNGVATVEVAKGNSVSWNQLAQNGNFANTNNWNQLGVVLSVSNNVGTLTETEGPYGHYIYQNVNVPVGHKVFVGAAISGNTGFALAVLFNNSTQWAFQDYNTTGATISKHIFTITGSPSCSIQYRLFGTSDNTPALIKNVVLFDLTLKFGAGNEPSTVAAFESWLAANVGSKPYYPASSKLLSTKLLKYVSRGFNQWDEEWEVGGYDTNGLKDSATNKIRSKNKIPVFPNTTYYFKNNNIQRVCQYDADENFISVLTINSSLGTTASNCYFITFNCVSAYGTTYENDICINLSWDGSRDGEYEPGVKYEYNLDVTKFYGKLNGEGDLTQIFPGGMRKADYAGTARDLLDLVNAEAYVKVAKKVFDGTESFDKISTYNAYRCAVGIMDEDSRVTFISNLYNCVLGTNTVSSMPDRSAKAYGSGGLIDIKDERYSDAESFETYLAGLYSAGTPLELYFELATPLHYTDLVYRDNGVDTPVEALNVIVNNWSTEEEIIAAPEESGDPNSCAATLDILYGIDAAEQLDTINQSGIFTDDLKANLEALIGVINTNCAEALGGTLSISDTPTDKVYTFTFTPTSQGE